MTTLAAPAAVAPLSPAHAAALRALGASAGGQTAARLLALLYDPNVDADRIVACLRGEPVLAARVLKVANSPYYGQSGRVGSLERAIQILGMKSIRGIAAAGALDRITPGSAGRAFDAQQFRRHSGAVACAAQALARRCQPDLEGEAFMAGLLHDIGVLLLVKADPQVMARFEPDPQADEATAQAAERAHFGLTHEAAGVIVAEHWAMPAWLKQVLGHHHAVSLAREDDAGSPTDPAAARLVALLSLANGLAGRAGFGLWPRGAAAPLERLAESLALMPEDLEAVSQALPQAVDALGLGG